MSNTYLATNKYKTNACLLLVDGLLLDVRYLCCDDVGCVSRV